MVKRMGLDGGKGMRLTSAGSRNTRNTTRNTTSAGSRNTAKSGLKARSSTARSIRKRGLNMISSTTRLHMVEPCTSLIATVKMTENIIEANAH